ncbi:MAG: ABC transporter ATP-binding protein [Thermaerobacter sp.]|jgi:NitT/TauT family transport system ATP-binding protein|nr:ABC transporter ATP-binding protein [Thermaerobacter sp.]MDA8147042.1 ABC transporter ATP-binding protein [Thermaerobacter sp.]
MSAGGALSIRQVTKVYDPEGVHVVAVDNCSLEVASGEFLVVVGPSGCGKTTLLNVIAGFEELSEGEIRLDEGPLALPGKQVGPGAERIVVFQNGALFPWKTVLENIAYGPVVQRRMAKNEAQRSARELLRQVGLEGIEESYPAELSSGVQRRVEILRALINEPRVVLLDEPFRGLDAVAKSVMHQFLLDMFERTRCTMYFITHDLDEAIFLADRVVVMTTRPARVKLELSIDLPRPRDHRVLGTERFLKLKQAALEAVHEEALKAFQAGERELA